MANTTQEQITDNVPVIKDNMDKMLEALGYDIELHYVKREE